MAPVCIFPAMTLCGRVRLEETSGGNWRPWHSGCAMIFAGSFYPHLQCELWAKGRTKWKKCGLVRKAFINLKGLDSEDTTIKKSTLYHIIWKITWGYVRNQEAPSVPGSSASIIDRCVYSVTFTVCYGWGWVAVLLLKRGWESAAESEIVAVYAGSLRVCFLAMTAGWDWPVSCC